jgi:hypothetical protein
MAGDGNEGETGSISRHLTVPRFLAFFVVSRSAISGSCGGARVRTNPPGGPPSPTFAE